MAVAAASIAALISLAYSAVSARGGAAPARAGALSTSRADDQNTATAQANDPAERLDAEFITIRPSGFEPAEVTRTDGRFLLMFENRSGLEDLSLSIHRQHGGPFQETRLSKHLLDWRGVVTLPPGRYVVTEAEHPDWRCQITIGN
jgi:hypothetical protein